MTRLHSRRDFLKTAAVTGSLAAGHGFFSSRAAADSKSPNEKLNIGAIGTANQARFSLGNVGSENLVAVCDIDDNYLDKAAKDFPRRKNTTTSASCSSRKISTPSSSPRPTTCTPRPRSGACGSASTSTAKSR